MPRRGRPAKVLTELQVAELTRMAELHLPVEDCAYVLDVSARTLKRNFADALKRGRACGRYKLRQAMWEAAVIDKKPAALIFSAKQPVEQGGLGWTDRIEQTNYGDTSITVRYLDRPAAEEVTVEHPLARRTTGQPDDNGQAHDDGQRSA